MNVIKREFRVALSRKAQPVWFRILKWVVLIVVVTRYHAAPSFWYWMLVALVLALVMHFFYRWKTHAWTRPWGGWKDLDAGR